MNKIVSVLLLTLTVFAAVLAAPVDEFGASGLDHEVAEIEDEEFAALPEDHLRFRRVTCDLLSFKGLVGDSACAANCLSMGKAGGRCNNGVCQCRKTGIKDLWDKRFG